MNIDIEVPEGLDPRLTALGWLVGTWEGTGNGTDAAGKDFQFEQRIQFWPGSGPYVYYMAQAFALDEDGKAGDMIEMETGFWRPQPDASIEVTVSNGAGWTELLLGKIQVTRIDLRSDVVVCGESSDVKQAAEQRLYGKVEGDLMYAIDRSTDQHELRPYMWARLKKV